MSASAPDSVLHAPHRRWRIAVLLGIGVLVNFFDRVNISVAYDALRTNWGITAVTFGYLASAYNWTYAVLQIPSASCSIAGACAALAASRPSSGAWPPSPPASRPAIYSFFAARLLLGVGEAPTFPANAKAVGYWFPERERSFATSINDAAAKFASAIGVPILGLLVIRFGWRWSFHFHRLRQLPLLPPLFGASIATPAKTRGSVLPSAV